MIIINLNPHPDVRLSRYLKISFITKASQFYLTLETVPQIFTMCKFNTYTI